MFFEFIYATFYALQVNFILKIIILNIFILTRKYTLMQVENVGVTLDLTKTSFAIQ